MQQEFPFPVGHPYRDAPNWCTCTSWNPRKVKWCIHCKKSVRPNGVMFHSNNKPCWVPLDNPHLSCNQLHDDHMNCNTRYFSELHKKE